MKDGHRLEWGRVAIAVAVSVVVPILVLVAVVTVYAFTKDADSATPEEFAPLAGNWVGPICGFLMTLAMARWCARRASRRAIAHGVMVGAGVATLDFIISLAVGGSGSIQPLLLASNMGKVVAGTLGGWLAKRSKCGAVRT